MQPRASYLHIDPSQAFYNDLNSVGYQMRNYYSQQQKESLCLSAPVLWHDFCFKLLDLTASEAKWKCQMLPHFGVRYQKRNDQHRHASFSSTKPR